MGEKREAIHYSRSIPQGDPQRLLRFPVPGRRDNSEQGQAPGFEQAQEESRNSLRSPVKGSSARLGGGGTVKGESDEQEALVVRRRSQPARGDTPGGDEEGSEVSGGDLDDCGKGGKSAVGRNVERESSTRTEVGREWLPSQLRPISVKERTSVDQLVRFITPCRLVGHTQQIR
jgi:hypothetical protein